MREKSSDKKNSGIAGKFHCMDDGDTENISEIGSIEQQNKKRRTFPLL